jgi:hypothetical protein
VEFKGLRLWLALMLSTTLSDNLEVKRIRVEILNEHTNGPRLRHTMWEEQPQR